VAISGPLFYSPAFLFSRRTRYYSAPTCVRHSRFSKPITNGTWPSRCKLLRSPRRRFMKLSAANFSLKSFVSSGWPEWRRIHKEMCWVGDWRRGFGRSRRYQVPVSKGPAPRQAEGLHLDRWHESGADRKRRHRCEALSRYAARARRAQLRQLRTAQPDTRRGTRGTGVLGFDTHPYSGHERQFDLVQLPRIFAAQIDLEPALFGNGVHRRSAVDSSHVECCFGRCGNVEVRKLCSARIRTCP
jgi:hypothetical protein